MIILDQLIQWCMLTMHMPEALAIVLVCALLFITFPWGIILVLVASIAM